MRPQHNAAENVLSAGPPASTRAASMRPQHNAAENLDYGALRHAWRHRFNEAAA